MSWFFVIKDTNYYELLNISGYRQGNVKESYLCHDHSSPKTNYSELLNISGYIQDTVKE